MVELAVVIPTFNERANVVELVRRLEQALAGVVWEAVFVDDDSPDATADVLRGIAAANPRVRCLQRIGRRGLSSAVIEGILSTSAPYVAVMDADLQHDESLLPTMLSRLRQEPLDVVVASRYCQGGSVGRWDEPRARMSRWATALARATLRVRLTDPMSGFFMLRREVFHESVRRLSGQGYKILLDLFASARQRLRFAELPYTFRERSAGESKLDAAVAWEYVLLLIDKTIGRWIPTRFVMFSLVGTLGLLVHFSALSAGYKLIGLDFSWAQTLATLTAMTCNFALNNRFTYRDRRLRGWRWLTGLLSFYLVCGLGVLGNVGIAVALFDRQEDWLLAGAAGAVVGTVWNFVASSAITWRQR